MLYLSGGTAFGKFLKCYTSINRIRVSRIQRHGLSHGPKRNALAIFGWRSTSPLNSTTSTINYLFAEEKSNIHLFVASKVHSICPWIQDWSFHLINQPIYPIHDLRYMQVSYTPTLPIMFHWYLGDRRILSLPGHVTLRRWWWQGNRARFTDQLLERVIDKVVDSHAFYVRYESLFHCRPCFVDFLILSFWWCWASDLWSFHSLSLPQISLLVHSFPLFRTYWDISLTPCTTRSR